MKSRLRKIANHVDQYIHKEVEYMVSKPNLKEQEDRSFEFSIAKKLFACTPFVHFNSIVYKFAERLRNGDYGVITSFAEIDNDLDKWLKILNDFLNEEKVSDSKFYNQIKTANNNLYNVQHTDSLYTKDYLDMNKDVKKDNVPMRNPEKENFINNSFLLAKDLINSLPIVPRYDLMSQIAQDIERGDYDDISPMSEARNHWDEWLLRTKQILRFRNIILSQKRLLRR
jgi:hypothetical protein